MMHFTDTTYFGAQSDVLYTLIDDEAVLMREADNTLFGVNSVATEIWKQLSEQPMNIRMLVDYLLKHFEIDEESCRNDTQKLLTDLLKEKLIYITDENVI